MSDIPGYTVIAPLAYIGKEGCTNVTCTRMLDGSESRYRGYHCSYCDEPCSMMGHRCPAAVALIEAAQRIHEEGSA